MHPLIYPEDLAEAESYIRMMGDSGLPDSGVMSGLVASLRGIEYRDLESGSNAIRNAELRYRTLVEQIPAVTFMISLDGIGNELYVSPQIETMLGYSQEEWLKNPILWYERIHPDDRDHWQVGFALTCSTGKPFHSEYRFISRAGEIVWVSGEAKVVRDEQGRPLFLHGIAFDISRHKQAEETLRRSQEFLEASVRERTAELSRSNASLRAEIAERELGEARIREQATLIDEATDAILVHDLAGRLLFWNRGAERLFLWSREEVIGLDVHEVLFRNTGMDVEEAARAVADRGEWAGELNLTTRDGRNVTVANRWTMIRDGEGAPKSILIFGTDVTAQRELQASLFRAQRLESIGTLAGGIAHDLNNLLTPLLMSVELLRMPLPEVRREAVLDMLGENVERGTKLVKQILTFARGGEGPRVPVAIGPLIRELGRMLSAAVSKSIEIEIATLEEPWFVLGDPTMIHQVLLNLCVNGCDAMGEGGVLMIAAENVLLDASFAATQPGSRPGRYVAIRVEDTGSGIPPEVLDKIFDPFFTTKDVGKGTGLGLSTAASIVKGLGGFLVVRTELGQGTQFSAYLRASEEPVTTEIVITPTAEH